jgi:ankyrin repeat protein
MSDGDLLDFCENGAINAVRELLSSKADVNIVMDDVSPLQVSVNNNNCSLALVLIEAGANVNATNSRGCTPLFYSKSDEMVNLLLDHGANIDHRDSDGSTPLLALWVSPCEEHDAVARTLMSRNADVSVRTDKGETVLMRAVAERGLETVRLLLGLPSAATLLEARSGKGNTAFNLRFFRRRADA